MYMLIPVALAAVQATGSLDTKPGTIWNEVCVRPVSDSRSSSDYAGTDKDEIVVVARRVNHNPTGKSLLVNCTGYKITSILIAPDEQRSRPNREILNPRLAVQIPGEPAPYLLLNFNPPKPDRYNPPTDSLFVRNQMRRTCKFKVLVSVRRPQGMKKLMRYFNTCESYVLVVQNVPPESALAYQEDMK